MFPYKRWIAVIRVLTSQQVSIECFIISDFGLTL